MWCCQRSSPRQTEKRRETTLPPVSSLRTYQAAAWSSITVNLSQRYVLTIGHTWMKRASMDTPPDWHYTDHTSHSFCPPCLCLNLWRCCHVKAGRDWCFYSLRRWSNTLPISLPHVATGNQATDNQVTLTTVWNLYETFIHITWEQSMEDMYGG